MELTEELNRVADAYRGQGYNVTVHPAPDDLPAFARDFKVELLGQRGGEGVVVAVRRNRDEVAADADMQRYAEVTGTQPGWRFDFAILEAENPKARELGGTQELSERDILKSLEQAEALSRMGFSRFAVVAAWAALEAAMRKRLRGFGQEAEWPSMPRQMLKELYSAGELSPDEFHRVDMATRLRNEIVHGFAPRLSNADYSEASEVQFLSDLSRRLVSELQPEAQQH